MPASAGGWLVIGAPSASTHSTAKVASASGRGGNTAARVSRCTWNHRPKIIISATPRWTKTKSENSRSPTAPTVRKLRASGVASSGSASSHSAVATAENWPSWSQLSQKPPIALTKANTINGTPVSHEKRRMPW